MRRQRAPQEAAGVSLFSFLAVLLCTMGALIVLLVVIARQARLEAIQRAAATAVAEADDEQTRAMLQTAIERLHGQRDIAATGLADARLHLSHLEDHAQRLAARLRELQSAASDLQAVADSDDVKRRRQQEELKMLEAHIRAVEDELADAEQTSARQANSYAVVPYEGPNQTRRRPVYLECRAEGIVLQPEEVILTPNDFDQPIGPGNPLAAALRATREHLSRTGLTAGEEPYPLMLVRPDGMASYYVARAALASWGAEFGYELVDADWELDFDPPDPQLARAQREAIAAARRRQHVLASLPDRGGLDTDRPIYRASRDKGGAVLESAAFPFGGPTATDDSNNLEGATAGTSSSAHRERSDASGQAGGATLSTGRDSDDNRQGAMGERSLMNQFEHDTARDAAAGGRRGPDSRSLANARGDDWGLEGRVPGSVGIGRSIHVVCRGDRLTLLSSLPDRVPNQQIMLGKETADSVDELVSGVWRQVEFWGTAGHGMHWRPELVIEVAPDGSARYDDLQALLSRSGLVVRRRGQPPASAAIRGPDSPGVK